MRKLFSTYGKLFFAILFIFIFFLIAQDFLKSSIYNIDQAIYNDFIKPIINDTNTSIFKLITNMVGVPILLVISALSYLFFKNKKYTFYIIINLGLVVCLNLILKEIFSRARPEDLMIIQETGYSFPSGHSMAGLAFYGFFIYLIYKSNWKIYIKHLSAFAIALLIFAIGLSRVYLGVHYTSDVLAGFSISLAYLLIYTTIISKLLSRKNQLEDVNAKGPLWKSFHYAFQGIIKSTVVERNMAIHFTIMLMVIIFGFTFSISIAEWIICVVLFGLVISLELVNTSVEHTIDICMPKFHPMAKIAKDTAAGAVLIAAIAASIIGLLIFVPKILELFNI